MNDDLINREALKKDIEENSIVLEGVQAIEVDCAKVLIDNAPTVPLPDFKEGYKQAIIDGKTNFSRPRGEWIGNNFDEHHCSMCGHLALYQEEPDDYYEVQSNFCPNCGADMRGSRE